MCSDGISLIISSSSILQSSTGDLWLVDSAVCVRRMETLHMVQYRNEMRGHLKREWKTGEG